MKLGGLYIVSFVRLSMEILTGLLRHESGATAIEWGLIAGLIAVVIATAVAFNCINFTSVFANGATSF